METARKEEKRLEKETRRKSGREREGEREWGESLVCAGDTVGGVRMRPR